MWLWEFMIFEMFHLGHKFLGDTIEEIPMSFMKMSKNIGHEIEIASKYVVHFTKTFTVILSILFLLGVCM